VAGKWSNSTYMDPKGNKPVQNEPKGVLKGGESALIYSPKDLHPPFNDGNLIK